MNEKDFHHGKHYAGQNPRGWFVSEKFRGARAYWDGHTLWSRGGVAIPLPPAWRAALPTGFALDGEVWAGRGPANGAEEVEAAQAVTHGRFTNRLRFLVFDAPGVSGAWPVRMAVAARQLSSPLVSCVGATRIESRKHLEKLFAEVILQGGEGLMLRDPRAPTQYERARTRTLLKVKLDPALMRGVVRDVACAA